MKARGGRAGITEPAGAFPRLAIENGTLERPFASNSLWITEGHIDVGGRTIDNGLPLPFNESGHIRLVLSGAEGELVVRGDGAYLEPTGPAVFIEAFTGCDEA